MVKQLVYMVMLATMAVTDIRKQSVSVLHIGLFTLVMWLINMMNGVFDSYNAIVSIMGGIILMIYGLITGFIGLADSIVLMVTGMFMGYIFALNMLCIALFILIAVRIIVLVRLKGKGTMISGAISVRCEIPFLPYLFIGALGVMLLG